jgi:hypothetical protein
VANEGINVGSAFMEEGKSVKGKQLPSCVCNRFLLQTVYTMPVRSFRTPLPTCTRRCSNAHLVNRPAKSERKTFRYRESHIENSHLVSVRE